jgi:hypothetical protein
MAKFFKSNARCALGLRAKINYLFQIILSMQTCRSLQGFGSHTRGGNKTLFFEKI